MNNGDSVTDKQVHDAYTAGTKAGYNQCRTEAAIRIAGLERDLDKLNRLHGCAILVIRDLVAALGVAMSQLQCMQRAHDFLQQIEGE